MMSDSFILTTTRSLIAHCAHDPMAYGSFIAYMGTSARVRRVCLGVLHQSAPNVSWNDETGPIPGDGVFAPLSCGPAPYLYANMGPGVWADMVASLARANRLCSFIAFSFVPICRCVEFLGDLLKEAVIVGNLALVQFLGRSTPDVFWQCAEAVIMREDGAAYARVLFARVDDATLLAWDDEHDIDDCERCAFVHWVCNNLIMRDARDIARVNTDALAYMMNYAMQDTDLLSECSQYRHMHVFSALEAIEACVLGPIITRACNQRALLDRAIAVTTARESRALNTCMMRILRETPDVVDEDIKNTWTYGIVAAISYTDGPIRNIDLAEHLGMSRAEGALRVIREFASMAEPPHNPQQIARFARVLHAFGIDHALLEQVRVEFARTDHAFREILEAFVIAGALTCIQSARGLEIFRWK